MTNFVSSQPTPDNSSKKVQSLSRFYYMDNLRALAMLLGIFFHAALAYVTTLQELWLAADPANSEVIGFDSLVYSHVPYAIIFYHCRLLLVHAD